MSSDDILAQLVAEGEVESAGGFSIDKEKARDKMRQFQLSDPRQYVLMLVQAAVHQGATHIEFQIDADDMEVWFDGQGFSKSDLDDLFVSMFGDRAESNLRSRQELAIALNAALALNPRWVRLWSHRADAGPVQLELRPGTESLPPAEDAPARDKRGTSIHVKQRFRPGLVLEFVKNLKGTIAEEFILRERARFAEVPIILDGARISSGVRLGTVVGRVEVEGPGVRGACGFRAGTGPIAASLDVLNAGVWMSTHGLQGFPIGFVAMVDGVELRKDVSQTDVIRDDVYEDLLGRLRTALERSLLALAHVHRDDPDEWFGMPETVRARMPIWIADRIEAPWRLEPVGDVLPSYYELPIWQQLDGTMVSSASLKARPYIDFISRPASASEEFATAICLPTEQLRRAFRTLFGTQRDRTSAYEAAFEREERRAQVMARRWTTRLGEGLYLARGPIEAEGFEGEVGFRRGDREEPVVQLVYQGRLLETIVLNQKYLHLPGFVAVVEGKIEPTASWKRAQRDEGFAEAIHAVIRATALALEFVGHAIPEPPGEVHDTALQLARSVCSRSFDRAFYRAVGVSAKRTSRWVNKFGKSVAPDPFEPRHPLLDAGLFRSLDRGWVSLGMLHAEHDAKNPVRVLPAGGKWPGTFPGYVVAPSEGLVLLREVLGEDAVDDGVEAYHVDANRAKWLAQPEEPFELFGDTVVEVDFEDSNMEIKAGMLTAAALGGSKGGKASVRVMKERRTVELTKIPCAIGGLVATIDWPKAPTTADYSALRDKGKSMLRSVINRIPARLFVATLERVAAGNAGDTVIASLRHLMLLVFRGPRWLEAFDACCDDRDAQVATDRLCSLLRIAHGKEDLPSEEVVSNVFAGAAAKVPPRSGGAFEVLARKVGPAWLQVRHLPLFPALGKPVSMAQLLKDYRRHDRALVVDERGAPQFKGEVPRIVLTASLPLRGELEQVFGRDRIADGGAWFQQWRAREAFEQQPKVSLDLDRDEVLVAVAVQAKGTQGEIGIPRALPGPPSASIVACRRKRRVCHVDVSEVGASLVGVLQADSFGVDREYTSLSERDIVRIAAACKKALPELAEALDERWSSFTEDELVWARAWGRLLLELLIGEGSRKALGQKGPRALAELPIFPHADGSWWTIDAIDGLHRDGERVYIQQPGSEHDGVFPKLTFAVQANVESVLERVTGTLEDLAEALRKSRAREFNRTASPEMPKPPADAVEMGNVSGRGIEGLLWIDERLDEGAVALGDKERVAGFTDVSAVFVVGGAIHGPAVEIDDAWEFAGLSKRAAQLLRKRAQELYEVVHERWDPDAKNPDRNWYRDRTLLRALLERMCTVWDGAGTKSSSAPARRLFKALRKLPLFELPNGRIVDLEKAQKFSAPPPKPVAPDPDEILPPLEPEPKRDTKPEPKPEPKPKPKAKPKSKAKPKPEPKAVLLDEIRTELRIVRKGSVAVLSNSMLDMVSIGRLGQAGVLAAYEGGRVTVSSSHEVTGMALQAKGDQRARLVSLLASSVFTAFNLGLDEVTDAHEVEFHGHHARHLAT